MESARNLSNHPQSRRATRLPCGIMDGMNITSKNAPANRLLLWDCALLPLRILGRSLGFSGQLPGPDLPSVENTRRQEGSPALPDKPIITGSSRLPLRQLEAERSV